MSNERNGYRTALVLFAVAVIIAILMAFATTLILQCLRAGDRESRELGWGLTGFLIVWLIAIPDVVQALFWLIAGVAAGHLRRHQLASAPEAAREALLWPAH